jgi:hypothetical protein
MFRQVRCFLTLALVATIAAGCGGAAEGPLGDRPNPVSASGTVTYNGDPLEGASVIFHPQGHDHGASGLTDSSGRFQLQAFEPGDGAVPGNYQVTVRKVEVVGAGDEDAPASDDDLPDDYGQERWLSPKKYADTETSDLTATVSEKGGETFTFELTD